MGEHEVDIYSWGDPEPIRTILNQEWKRELCPNCGKNDLIPSIHRGVKRCVACRWKGHW